MSSNERLEDIKNKIPQDFSIYGSLFAVANKVQAAGDKYLDNVTMRQQYLLMCLALFEDYAPTLQELADVFGSSYQNVKRMALQLEEKGYLTIRRDAIDRRKIRLSLDNEKFAELCENLVEGNNKFISYLFEGIDQDEKATLDKALIQMRKNLDKMEND